MRPSAILNTLLLLALSICAAVGWVWGWQERGQLREGEFTRRRLALLERENTRLSGVIAEKQRADEQTADRAGRMEIESEITRLRELDFRHPVTFREIPRAELPNILRQKLAQQVPDKEFGETGIALGALGLIPAGLDLKKTYLDLLGEQIGAFYDQHSHELFTFSGNPLSKSQNRVILAHELTHALQDQHFNLERLPLEAKGNDDRVLAASALVEGDATLAMNQYLLANANASAIKDIMSSTFTTDVSQLAAAPRYLRESLLFPYLRGQEFCQTLYQRDGWDALAAAFAEPPSSTAQILHPEKFLAQPREEPVAVEFADTSVLDQKPIVDNVLGEFGSRQLFAAWLHDDKRAADAASAWRGDRYLVYGDAKASSYAWKTVCADKAGAEEFAQAAMQALNSRYRVKTTHTEQIMPLRPDPLARTGSAESLQRNAYLKGIMATSSAQSGNRSLLTCVTSQNEVIVIDAQDARWSAALAKRFAPGAHFD